MPNPYKQHSNQIGGPARFLKKLSVLVASKKEKMAQSSAEEEGATSTPNITGEGKGVKRAPEEKQEHQERQGGQKHEEGEEAQEKGGPGKRAVSASTPPTKLAKPNPFDNAAAGSTSSSSSGGLAPGKGLEDRGAAEAQGRGAGSSDSEKVETEALRSLDLAVGTRLEVMWVLEDGDESVEKVRREGGFWSVCHIAIRLDFYHRVPHDVMMSCHTTPPPAGYMLAMINLGGVGCGFEANLGF